MDVNSERLITRYAHVNPEIEFVTIYKQWIGDILGDDRSFFNVDVVDVVDKVDAFSLAGVGWFQDPDVLFGLVLF